MTLSNGILRSTVVMLLAALALVGRAAVPISPELQAAGEAGRMQEINLRAEASLREKVEVGKQRYAQQQEFQQALIQGIASTAEERREEISADAGKLVEGDDGFTFDLNSLTWVLIAAAVIYRGVRYYRTHDLGDLDFGLHQPLEPVVQEKVSVDKALASRWKDFVNAVALPAMDESHLKAHKRSGRVDSIKIALDISVKLCVDIAPALQSTLSEERVKQQLQELFQPYGIRTDDDSQVWLALLIQGKPVGETNTFSHAEKIAFLERGTLLKSSLLAVAAVPELLWGAEHAGYADQSGLEGEVHNVLQVFAEMFLKELLVSKPTEAGLPTEPSPQFVAAAHASI